MELSLEIRPKAAGPVLPELRPRFAPAALLWPLGHSVPRDSVCLSIDEALGTYLR